MKSLMLLLLFAVSSSFASTDTGTGSSGKSTDTGTGGSKAYSEYCGLYSLKSTDTGTGGGKSTDTGTGGKGDSGTGQVYMLYLECVNQNRNLKWID